MGRRLFLVGVEDGAEIGETEHGDRVFAKDGAVEAVELVEGDVLVVGVPKKHPISEQSMEDFCEAVGWSEVVFVPKGMSFDILTRRPPDGDGET